MLRTAKLTLILLMGGLVFAIASSSFSAEADSLPVSPELLKHAGLKIVWEGKLPMRNSESLRRLFFIGDKLYGLSNKNYMTSMDISTGKTVFATQVAPKGVTIGRMILHEGVLLTAHGGSVVMIDPKSGDRLRTSRMDYDVVCPPGANSSFLYLSGDDNRLHVLRAEDRVEIFEVADDNQSKITSILADDSSVIFATDAGNVVSMLPDRAKRLWKFDAADSIVGSMVRDGSSLFFASNDTNVYRLNITGSGNRAFVWKHQVPGIPENEPRVTRSVVYQAVRGKGVVAIEISSARQLWILPDGAEFLAERGNLAYVLTHHNTLAVMDNGAGRKLYEVNFAAVSMSAPNVIDSNIYVGGESGWVMCLQPVR